MITKKEREDERRWERMRGKKEQKDNKTRKLKAKKWLNLFLSLKIKV